MNNFPQCTCGKRFICVGSDCPGGYAPAKMQIRNEYMVENCDLLIAVWDKSDGGTANCVKYAKSQRKNIIYINPKEI